MERKEEKFRIDDTLYDTEIHEWFSKKPHKTMPDPREVRAIIPGTVIEVKVKKGQFVRSAQIVLVLEAMKMHNNVEAEIDGVIEEVNVSAGDRVEKDKVMIRIRQ
jgi:biotin carboxyl carrier protein